MAEPTRVIWYTDAPEELDMASTISEPTGYSYFGKIIRRVRIIRTEKASQDEAYEKGEHLIIPGSTYDDLKARGKLKVVETTLRQDGTIVHVHVPVAGSTPGTAEDITAITAKEESHMSTELRERAIAELKAEYKSWQFKKTAQKEELIAEKLEEYAALSKPGAKSTATKVAAAGMKSSRVADLTEQLRIAQEEEARDLRREAKSQAQAAAARVAKPNAITRTAENSQKATWLIDLVARGRDQVLLALESRVVEVGYILPTNVIQHYPGAGAMDATVIPAVPQAMDVWGDMLTTPAPTRGVPAKPKSTLQLFPGRKPIAPAPKTAKVLEPLEQGLLTEDMALRMLGDIAEGMSQAAVAQKYDAEYRKAYMKLSHKEREGKSGALSRAMVSHMHQRFVKLCIAGEMEHYDPDFDPNDPKHHN